ncbi:50S ribosomal protein L11 methyltransferase [bacterium]|nr:MAG: 50S ribosomal protein L11 methyltransferase [bacterium]
MTNTLEITYHIDEPFQDALIAELFDLGFSGFDQHATYMQAFIEEPVFHEIDKNVYEDILEPFGGLEIEGNTIVHHPKNWNEEWEKTIQPITVGEYYIRPTWNTETFPTGKIELIIDPKMAFGTGYHETTRLMLHALTAYIKPNDSVLDVGTGTGIIAIAALKKGAKEAFGFDIDEWSFANAQDNATLNGIESGLSIRLGSFETVPDETYDVVIANVNRSAILALKQDIAKHCKPNGYILLSGLLNTEAFIIKEDAVFTGLQLLEEVSEGDWTGLIYQKV